jgi:hypothetical protein
MNCACTILNGGWCERHQVKKTAHWVHLCREVPGYWELWEAGKGPGQKWDPSMPSRGLGDTIAKLTHATGIDKVVKAVTKNRPGGCGCAGRQAALNRAVPYGR